MSIELFTCNDDNYHNNHGNDDNDSSEKGGNMGCGIGDVANQPRGDGGYEIDYSDDPRLQNLEPICFLRRW